jgi:site-specific DNA-methyltransferase (adenine-specific)
MTPYYQDELVTLYHGDCREITEWLSADVLVTDPPYGIDAESKKGTFRGAGSQVRRAAPIAGDKTTAARDAALALWGNKPRVVFGSWRAPRPDPVDHRLIWHKRGSVLGVCRAAFISQDEEIYVTGRGFRESQPPMRSVIATDEPRHGANGAAALIGHPTPKPIGLMEILIDRCPAGIIADPFAGSGSTLVAAKRLGRKAIGVELDERYCEIAARRLSQDVLDFGASA